jgi:hypothetical protein
MLDSNETHIPEKNSVLSYIMEMDEKEGQVREDFDK